MERGQMESEFTLATVLGGQIETMVCSGGRHLGGVKAKVNLLRKQLKFGPMYLTIRFVDVANVSNDREFNVNANATLYRIQF